jgi:Ca-activated chloride channel family protein
VRTSLLILALALSAAAQDDVVFRSGVSLVRVDAEAVDSGGQVVSGLTKDDFIVRDEGQPQTLVNFSFEVDPLDLILLFDMAGSMHGKVLGVVRAAELGFHELKKGDRIDVMVFNTRAQDVQPFTSDLDLVNQAILLRVLGLKFGGGSQIEMPAVDAAQHFRTESKSKRKRAVLVITDKAGGNSSGANAAVRDLWASDAILSELILSSPGPTRLMERETNAIVDRTGGATIVAGVPGEAFQESVHYLRSGYSMYYPLPDAAPGSERHLQLELTAAAAQKFPGTRLRARSGYIVPAR